MSPVAAPRRYSQGDMAIIPPDGGWGWVVVFAAFYCQIIIDGIQLTFGMILQELSDSYDVDVSHIALIGSIIYGMHYLCGPLCSSLSFLWSDRVVCVIGSVLACICISSAYFQPPLIVLYLFTGALGGLGLGFVNMTSIVVPTLYFTKHRLIAIGLVVCGTGVGTMVFAAVTTFVLRQYNDWRYVCLLEGVLALTMLAAAMTFRPLRATRVQANSTIRTAAVVVEDAVDSVDETLESKPARIFYLSKGDLVNLAEVQSYASDFVEYTQEALDDIAVNTAGHNGGTRVASRHSGILCCCCPCRRAHHHRILSLNPDMTSTLLDDVNSGIRQISTYPESDRGAIVPWRWYSIFSAMLDCRILKTWTFLAYCIAVSLSASALIIVLFYEKVRFIKEKRSEAQITYYMIWIGFCNMTWRLILGYISTLQRVNYHALNIVGLISGGLATLVTGVSDELGWMYFTASLYGLAVACFAVFYPVICVELVGRQNVSNATGVAMMFMGLFSIIGAPLSGMAYEAVDDIRVIFYIGGSMFVLSGIIFIFITGKPLRAHTQQPQHQQ